MISIKEKLSKLQTDEKSRWKEKAIFRRDNSEWLKKSTAIAVKVLTALKNQGLSQKDLAERMNVSPQRINKIVKGEENLTLETISKIEATLGIDIIGSALKIRKVAA